MRRRNQNQTQSNTKVREPNNSSIDGISNLEPDESMSQSKILLEMTNIGGGVPNTI